MANLKTAILPLAFSACFLGFNPAYADEPISDHFGVITCLSESDDDCFEMGPKKHRSFDIVLADRAL